MEINTKDEQQEAADQAEPAERDDHARPSFPQLPPPNSQLPLQYLPVVFPPLPRKICSNCGSISTPSWRRCPEGRNLLCNACGLYQKLHRRPRPLRIREDGSVQVIRNLHATQLVNHRCEACGSTESAHWQRDGRGRWVCGACSLPDDLIQRIFQPQ